MKNFLADEIRRMIESTVADSVVYVLDPNNDGQHFQAIVVSPLFAQMSLVRQHQTVLKALKPSFEGPLHALSLKTFTPEKWNEIKHAYGL